MGLLDFFRGLPHWAEQLPPHLRPAPDRIRQLEAIRIEVGASDADFLLHIAGHPETTRRVQRHFYKHIKQQMPGTTEREILKHLIVSRLTAAIAQGDDLFGLGAMSDEIALGARLDEIVSHHSTVESLIGAMIEDEAARTPGIPARPGFEEAARRVTDVLSAH